jgi:hypothetical protein
MAFSSISGASRAVFCRNSSTGAGPLKPVPG